MERGSAEVAEVFVILRGRDRLLRGEIFVEGRKVIYATSQKSWRSPKPYKYLPGIRSIFTYHTTPRFISVLNYFLIDSETNFQLVTYDRFAQYSNIGRLVR